MKHVQEQLDFTAPVVVRARALDPETSKEAAAALEADQPRMQRSVAVVVDLLRDAAVPISDFEIASRWARWWGVVCSESLPRKARHWARQAGLVHHEGYGQHNGRRVRLWTVTKPR